MDQHPLRRLQRVEVDRLFGIYDHRIDLNLPDRVTLLHGQNGVGKTSVLRMINALLRNDITYFGQIPFARFLLAFQDDCSLELTPSGVNNQNGRGVLKLTRNGRTEQEDSVELRSAAEFLANSIDHLEPAVGIENTWIDIRDGEMLSETEVLSRYGKSRRAFVRRESPPWFDEFLQGANTHLIEAQRLMRPRVEPTSWPDFVTRPFNQPTLTLSVVEYSQDFSKRLDHTMAAYGRQAQVLDQTFPERMISKVDELSVPQIQNRMKELDDATKNYEAIGILDKTTVNPFDIDSLGNLDDTQARVMTLYVHDTENKLAVLEDLANRTTLLLENVNGKFRHKKIHVDREQGLVAQDKGGQQLSLHSLSSGEQHELVLHYDLLFKTPPNTVVLLDEPELSLHVAWQKQFLPDLMNIVKLSDFDAIVATHSPFIVGERDDLMVPLGNSK